MAAQKIAESRKIALSWLRGETKQRLGRVEKLCPAWKQSSGKRGCAQLESGIEDLCVCFEFYVNKPDPEKGCYWTQAFVQLLRGELGQGLPSLRGGTPGGSHLVERLVVR